MTRREWLLVILLAALLVLNYWQQRQTETALTEITHQLDAKEQARIDLLEARVISLEKKQAEIRARLEGE